MIGAYAEKYGEEKDRVDFWWMDDTVEKIELSDEVTIHWRDGETSTVKMEYPEDRYKPDAYAEFYNEFLERVRKGEKKVKYRHLMGLGEDADETDEDEEDEDKADRTVEIDHSEEKLAV